MRIDLIRVESLPAKIVKLMRGIYRNCKEKSGSTLEYRFLLFLVVAAAENLSGKPGGKDIIKQKGEEGTLEESRER